MIAGGVSLAASTSATTWEKQYGESGDMTGSQVWQTEDNGFIVVGNGRDATNTGTNLYLTKFDWKGNEVWSKAIGGWTGNSVRQTSDGGFIATGTTSDYLYLVKADKNGNKVWEKSFQPGSTTIGYAVLPTDDGYIVVGQTSAGGSSEWDGYLLKTDMSGNKVWDKIISTNGDYYGNDFYYSVWQTSDGGYILGGNVDPGSGPQASLVKVDSGGNILWSKHYEDTTGSTSAGVQQTRDGGFIYAGAYGDKTLLLKTDASGNKQWAKIFDYPNSEAFSVQQAWDDGYVLTGKYVNVDQEAYKIIVIRTDASGNEQWHQMYNAEKTAEGHSVQQIGNGSFVVTGWTREDQYAVNSIDLIQIAKDMTPVPDARLVSDTIPSVWNASESYQVQATFENTGTMPWTFQDDTTFGHHGEASKFGVTGANQTIEIGKVIRPGQSETFVFVMTAPKENGTYNPRFQMMWEGHNVFGEIDNKTIWVVNGTGPEVIPFSTSATTKPTVKPSSAPVQSSATVTATAQQSQGGLPCISSIVLPLLAIGVVTVSYTMRKKKGDQ